MRSPMRPSPRPSPRRAAVDANGKTAYELERDERIKRNRAKMVEMGVPDTVQQLAALRPPPPARPPGAAREKAQAAPSTRQEPYPLRHVRKEARRKEVKKKPPVSKQQRAQQSGYRAAQEAEHRRRQHERAQWRVGVNDDGYGAPERVYGSDGSDHEEGGHGGPPGSVAADLAARYEQDAADAAAEEEALARRHAASGAAYFHSHGRQHGGHDLLTDLPLADEYTIKALLLDLPARHDTERGAMHARFQHELYPRWRALLEAGFSICAYGWGSKKPLLDEFVGSEPGGGDQGEGGSKAPEPWAPWSGSDGAAVVMNGYHPDASAKQLLAACASSVAAAPLGPNWMRGKSIADLLQDVASSTGGTTQRRLYVVIHNIDGPALRTADAQGAIAELAALPGVHLLASVDSVNFPLLWPKRLASRLRWVWEHVPTFGPYTSEIETVPRVLSGRGEERLVRGAASVLLSLTPNARAVFRLLADAQLRGTESYGLSFSQWYAACRQQFSVASEGALHVHLGEFLDHNLVKKVKRPDGTEALQILFTSDDLTQILEDINQ